MKFPQWMRRSLSKAARLALRRTATQEPLDEAERLYRVAMANWEIEQEMRKRRSDPPYYGP